MPSSPFGRFPQRRKKSGNKDPRIPNPPLIHLFHKCLFSSKYMDTNIPVYFTEVGILLLDIDTVWSKSTTAWCSTAKWGLNWGPHTLTTTPRGIPLSKIRRFGRIVDPYHEGVKRADIDGQLSGKRKEADGLKQPHVEYRVVLAYVEGLFDPATFAQDPGYPLHIQAPVMKDSIHGDILLISTAAAEKNIPLLPSP